MQCHVIMLNDSIQEVVLNATAEQANERRVFLRAKYLRDNSLNTVEASIPHFHVETANVVDMREGV